MLEQMTNDRAPPDSSDAASPPPPFVARAPGLGAFAPPPNLYAQATFRYERSVWLLAPLAFWAVGVAQRSVEAVAIALGAWILSYPIYGAWSLWRIRDADPKADLWRPAALLTLGVVPFAGLAPLFYFPSPAGFEVLVLVIYLVGVSALIAARSGWPQAPSRKLIAAAAAVAYLLAGLSITAVIRLAVAASRSRIVVWDIVFGGGGAAFALVLGLLGIGLTRTLRRARPAP
jgi:hypothetical protein